MFCRYCGHEVVADAPECPACHQPTGSGVPSHGGAAPPPPPPPPPRLTDDPVLQALRRAAHELATATQQASKELLDKADRVVDDPKGSAKRAVKKAAHELDAARKELEAALERLK